MGVITDRQKRESQWMAPPRPSPKVMPADDRARCEHCGQWHELEVIGDGSRWYRCGEQVYLYAGGYF